jgi:predicted Zn finger-like uncharacterized protein
MRGEQPSLYTQCAKCETVFRVSAQVLRAAGGQVRCGRCGEVFNALARLAEDPGAFPAGESPLDMESRANEILESPPAPLKPGRSPTGPGHEIIEIEEFDAADIDFARLQVVGKFDEPLPPVAPPATPPASPGAPAPAEDGAMEFTLPPGELDRVFVERSTHSHPSFELPEDLRRDMMSGVSEAAVLELPEAPRRSIPRNAWLGAAIVLALLLCAQLIHGNREWFASHAPMRGPLRGLYAAMGVEVAAPADLSAYQLRQWGVTGDPAASGTLRVRASIMNTAAQLQPYPLLRVTLANRFGTRIGARDFEPREYMGKPIVRMLAPGERADATLDIVDPGKDAEGFEIDVCVRGANRKISCAGDVAAQAKP